MDTLLEAEEGDGEDDPELKVQIEELLSERQKMIYTLSLRHTC